MVDVLLLQLLQQLQCGKSKQTKIAIMNYQDFVDNLDEKTVETLRTAVEIGKWENGERLTDKQRESAMQAVMLWQAKYEISSADEPFKLNNNGDLKLGKGKVISQAPLEYQVENDPSLIFSSKD